MGDAERYGHGNKAVDLFVPEDVPVGQDLHAPRRPAVCTGKITAVGNGNPEVIDAPVARIDKRHEKMYHRAS